MTIDVRGVIDQGIPVLTINYGVNEMWRPESAAELTAKMLEGYEGILAKEPPSRSCVVVIEAETAGAAIARALFELHEMVAAEGQQLLCAGYPEDYKPGIKCLGLPKGFGLRGSRDEAVDELKAAIVTLDVDELGVEP